MKKEQYAQCWEASWITTLKNVSWLGLDILSTGKNINGAYDTHGKINLPSKRW